MICTKCNIDKPETEEFFQVRADTKKFRRQCRVCRSIHTHGYHHSDGATKKEEEQRECFHYTNLQTLWAKDNFSKGGR